MFWKPVTFQCLAEASQLYWERRKHARKEAVCSKLNHSVRCLLHLQPFPGRGKTSPACLVLSSTDCTPRHISTEARRKSHAELHEVRKQICRRAFLKRSGMFGSGSLAQSTTRFSRRCRRDGTETPVTNTLSVQ